MNLQNVPSYNREIHHSRLHYLKLKITDTPDWHVRILATGSATLSVELIVKFDIQEIYHKVVLG